MNILVLTNLYPPDVLGGYELLAKDIVVGLRSRGHTVSVLASGTGRSVAGEARILRLSRPFGEAAGRDRIRHLVAAVHNGRATRRLLRTQGVPDAALIMSMRRLGLEPLRALQERRVGSVVTVNDDWPVAYAPATGSSVRARVARWVDRGPWWRHTWRDLRVQQVVYLSETTRREVLSKVDGFPEGMVCSQGVNLTMFEARPVRPIPPRPSLLFAGRIHPTKAPDAAIDALKSLAERGIGARLVMAGAPVSESYLSELQRRAESLGVAGQIEWKGQIPRERMADVYRAADILLFLSRWDEPQGLTHMEAMACGVPVVAYPLGGAKELLDSRDVSERAKACNGDAIAAAVIELMNNPDRQRDIVRAGRDLVKRGASLDSYIDVLAGELERSARASGGPCSN